MTTIKECEMALAIEACAKLQQLLAGAIHSGADASCDEKFDQLKERMKTIIPEEECPHCKVAPLPEGVGYAYLWGRPLEAEYEGDFNIALRIDTGEYNLKYEDEVTDNTSEPIKYCPMCGRKLGS